MLRMLLLFGLRAGGCSSAQLDHGVQLDLLCVGAEMVLALLVGHVLQIAGEGQIRGAGNSLAIVLIDLQPRQLVLGELGGGGRRMRDFPAGEGLPLQDIRAIGNAR